MAKPDLKISIKAEKDAVTVSLVGEAHFDLEAANERVDEVIALKPKVLNVDASKLTFISSTGICFLISLRNVARESKGKIYLRGLQPMVEQALKHARVLKLFDRLPEDAD
jgi:anti-anti-sigma factor